MSSEVVEVVATASPPKKQPGCSNCYEKGHYSKKCQKPCKMCGAVGKHDYKKCPSAVKEKEEVSTKTKSLKGINI